MTSASYTTYALALGTPLVLYVLSRAFSSGSRGRMPPGPRPIPLIGNMLDLPPATEHQWVKFTEWASTYGDMVSLNVLGQPIVVLNSLDIAVDLFEKRSAKYSARPRMVVAGEMIGWDQSLVLSPYGERFRDIRRLMHQYIGTEKAILNFNELEEREIQRFMGRVLQNPEDWSTHLRTMTGSIILKMAFGYSVKVGKERDELLHLVEEATNSFILSTSAGAFMADVFPILRYVPSWLSVTAWKQKVREWTDILDRMHNIPYEYAEATAKSDSHTDSFVARNLDFAAKSQTNRYHLKVAAGSLYAGGADTTVAAISTFFLAMTNYPEVQKKAQAELDSVTGGVRLPTAADKEQLPYIHALVSEVLRWQPIAPLGMPHNSSEDDTYGEYFFSKGTMFVPNIMKFLHDPEIYADPWTFNPERFLPDGGHTPEPDPRNCVFGFGRRSCPGMYLAENTLFLTCAMTLATFDIRPPVVDGKEAVPPIEYLTGTVSHPKPFRCDIRPRSDRAAALVMSNDQYKI